MECVPGPPPQRVAVGPEMVEVGSFSSAHTRPRPRTLAGRRLFEKARGDPPGLLPVGAPFLMDSHSQAFRRVMKLFTFPPGSRENPVPPLVGIRGPHTEFLCCNRAAVYLPGVLEALVLRCFWAGPIGPARPQKRVRGTGHTKSDWQKSTKRQLPSNEGKNWSFLGILSRCPPEKGLSFPGP